MTHTDQVPASGSQQPSGRGTGGSYVAARSMSERVGVEQGDSWESASKILHRHSLRQEERVGSSVVKGRSPRPTVERSSE